ncbi:unnamed protein product [Echinostoma caproni]|uniref:Hexosyltransferase n=1 Tax=Echinostoma caproni TaxID=27848 RepID=A0A183BAT6_9TREM|nr:unnamed protein product [Echinostoma caproni]
MCITCPVWRKCSRTCLTVGLSFILAYSIFQCVWFLVFTSILASPDPTHVINKLAQPPSPVVQLPRAHFGYAYSGKDVSLKPFLITSTERVANKPHSGPLVRTGIKQRQAQNSDELESKAKRPIPADEDEEANEVRDRDDPDSKSDQVINSPSPPVFGKWSTRHCKHNAPYYSNSHVSPIKSIQNSLPSTLHMLNTLSPSKQTSDRLTVGSILPHLCLTEQTQLLIVIQSDVRNSSQRNRIRQSWSSLDYFTFDATGAGDRGPDKVEYLFLVDFVHNQSVLNAAQLDLFTLEIKREQDVLPIRIIPEEQRMYHSYLQASEYILTRCGSRVQYVAFLTDDLMPNIPLLGSFARENRNRPRSTDHIEPMYCFSVEEERPIRPRKTKQPGKVIVTQSEWPRTTFPTYCDLRAGGFLISTSSLQLWMSCAHVYRSFIKLPQIFLTGILTEAAGVPIQRYWTTYGEPVPLLPSLGSGSEAGKHLFFTQTNLQPLWVWKSVFRSMLSEALR